ILLKGRTRDPTRPCCVAFSTPIDCWPSRCLLLNASVSLISQKHLQLGNAIVVAAEPPTKLAVDILYHHHIRMDVGLVACVEVSGRALVQHGGAFSDDGG